MVRLSLHVHAIHRNHPVPGPQPRSLRGGAGLHFADELAALPLLAMQVKSIPAVPFCHDTKPRFPLVAHFLRRRLKPLAESTSSVLLLLLLNCKCTTPGVRGKRALVSTSTERKHTIYQMRTLSSMLERQQNNLNSSQCTPESQKHLKQQSDETEELVFLKENAAARPSSRQAEAHGRRLQMMIRRSAHGAAKHRRGVKVAGIPVAHVSSSTYP